MRKRAQHERVKVLRRQVGCGSDVRDPRAPFGGQHVVENPGALVLELAAGLGFAESAHSERGEVGLVLPFAELSVCERRP